MSEQLVRVIAKWLGQVHCPSASHSLSRSVGCVVDLPDAAPGGNELSGWTVDVETLSGVQLGTFKGLDPSNTVHELQVRIAERLGHEKFPVHQQYLFLTGSASELSANATLQQCGVVDGATLVLVLRLNLEWDPQKSNSYLEYAAMILTLLYAFHFSPPLARQRESPCLLGGRSHCTLTRGCFWRVLAVVLKIL